MSIEAMLQETKELFLQFSSEVTTKKWIKVFIHKLDFHESLEILQHSDRKTQGHIFVKALLNENNLDPDLCNAYADNIKILSSSRSTGDAELPYLRLASMPSSTQTSTMLCPK